MNTASPETLRVVLDSNIYVSAFTHHQGAPIQIWRLALQRRYTLLISRPIVNEVAGVLRSRFGWDDVRIIRRLEVLTRVAEIVVPKITVNVITEDEADNRILECAVAGRAHLVVSGDHHLRRLKSFGGISIVRPVDFHRTLGA